MSYQILLGVAEIAVADQVRAIVEEDPEFSVVEIAFDGADVITALTRHEIDALVVHEDLGPLPVMDFARDVSARYPQVGIVLIAREPTPELLRSALHSGMRDVLTLPLAFEEIQ
jgi:pilus assembly protein CpaE